MYEITLIISAVLAISFFALYGGALQLTLSRGMPTFLTGAVLLWGVPGFLLIVALSVSAQWRGALAVLLITIAVTGSCALGSLVAKYRQRDRFEGALFGGMIGLFLLGMPISQFCLHWL
jgi:hypothetical protein